MRSKFNAKGIKYMFFGYCEDTKAYMLMVLNIKKIIKSPDVEFLEHKSACEDLEIYPSENNSVFVDTSSITTKKEENDDNEDGVNEDKEMKNEASIISRISNEDVQDIEDHDDDDEEYQSLSDKRQGLRKKKLRSKHGK